MLLFLPWLLMSWRADRYSQVMLGVLIVFGIASDWVGNAWRIHRSKSAGTLFLHKQVREHPLSAQCDCDLG